MPDIYDQMKNGDEQRAHNKRRLAELMENAAERAERIAMVVALAEEPLTDHVL